MNIDHILETFSRHQATYLLIGGMNFLLRHTPVLTYDVDLWIEDTPENCARCEVALRELEAEWGPSESDWGPVAARPTGWIRTQSMFCLTSPHGAIDVFRSVMGLESWTICRSRAQTGTTTTGTDYFGLADEDMLQCQLALPEGQRKHERIRILKKALGQGDHE